MFIPYTTGPPGCDVDSPSKEHPTDCHKFYECSPIVATYDFVEKTCGPTMLYNPQTRTCDWPEAVIAIKPSCGEKPITRTDATQEEKGGWYYLVIYHIFYGSVIWPT